ncbi:MAG: hypothetical protein Q9165_005520 [Trypethelium subeluteriae]
MVAFSTLFLAGSVVAGVFGAPRPDLGKTLSKRTTATPNGEGMGNDGFFYSIWSDGGDDMTFTNGADGEYSLTWSGSGDVVCGKGWKTGSDQNITYSGTYEPDGGSFLSVYGWFTDPLTEYYILENYGTADPSYGTELVGNLTSDGSVYSIHKTVRVNAASIEGTTTFNQFWSIRQDKRVGGTINTANHFNAWKAAGLDFSGFHYQIIATEGISGSGSSNIKIAAADSADTSPSAVSSSTAPSSSAVAPSPSAVSSAASSAVSPVTHSTAEPATSLPATSLASSVVNPVASSVESSIAVSPTSSRASSSASPVLSSVARSSEVSSTIAATTSSATSSVPSFTATSVAAPAAPTGASSASIFTSSTEEVVATTTIVTTTEVTVTIFASATGASTSAPAADAAHASSSWHHHTHPQDQTFGRHRH